MFSLLTRLIGSKLPTPVRVGLFVIVGIVIALVFRDIFYGVLFAALGGFGAWRQGRKTSFAAAPVVPEPPLPGFTPPTAPPAPAEAPPAAAPEGPSIYGG